MAEFRGEVYCSTLPSGHVYSYAAGATAMDDRTLGDGWHHVAAVKDRGELRLYVDGELCGRQSFDAAEYELTSDAPLRIGFGQNDYFHGRMHDVRCYDRALPPAEIQALSNKP
jgi:hypothetical protein